jgi:hypothetical protein
MVAVAGCSAENDLGGGGGRGDSGPRVEIDSGGGSDVDAGAGGGPCTEGATQSCYPLPSVGTGCMAGTQTCDAAGAWGPCAGATVPMEGATACCAALEDGLTHDMLDAFLAAYPPEAIPSDWHVIDMGWRPEVMGMRMTEARTVSGGEFIDPGRGGVTVENLAAGRADVRMAAMTRFMIEPMDILSMQEPEPTFLGGDGCTRYGSAWGSILFRTETGAVQEVVYVYVGICNDGDIEGFFASEYPTEICPEGTFELI